MVCACAALLPQCVQLDDGSGDPATWGTAEVIHDEGAGPALAIDSTGNVTAMWTQSDGAWTKRFAVDVGWGSATRISGQAAELAAVGVDSSGNAIATARETFVGAVIANRYRESTASWSANETRLATSESVGAGEPGLAVSANGTAIAVWAGDGGDPGSSDIWANRFSGSWQGAVEIEERDGRELSEPRVAVDSGGNGIAVWSEFDGARHDIYFNVYRITGWAGSERLETMDADATNPRVGLDDLGNALAVWTQSARDPADSPERVWASGYSMTDQVWETPVRIGPASESSAVALEFAMATRDGSAVAVWVQLDPDQDAIWVNRHTLGGGWEEPRSIGESSQGSTPGPSVAVHSRNGALVAWRALSNTGARRIQSSHFAPGAGWGPATEVAPDQIGFPSGVRVQMYGPRKAAAVWLAIGGESSNQIWFNRLE